MIELREREASIQPLKSKLKISILDDEEIGKINQMARDILEDVGIKIPSEKALRIFADANADVDFGTKIVRIPNDLVEQSLKSAPRRYTLHGRRSELDADIGGENGTYFYCSGEAPKVVDLETGERRLSVKSDIENMAKIADYLPIASLIWPTVSASDKGMTAPIHGIEACFNNTEKHIQSESLMDEVSAKYAIEMAAVVAGGKDKLRERPLFSLLLCGIAPLGHDEGGIESALVFAEAGLPVGIMSMPTMGLTAPPYPAGALAAGLAEALCGCVLLQIAYPGTPNFISIIPAIVNPRTGNYFMGSSYAQITSAAAVQLAHSNGLPLTACKSFGGSSYGLNNWQLGQENIVGHMLAVMAGADMSFGPSGMMEGVSLLDMRRILFDREILQVIDIVSDGIMVNEETMAFDMVREVGSDGMYLAQKRTAKELPRLWPPSILFEKPELPEERYKDPVKVAHESVEWILENHEPAPLAKKVKQELRRIVDAADQDAYFQG
ncbi:MAG: trimethylamine methyltransferase family protein [Anaerolineales bacterium]